MMTAAWQALQSFWASFKDGNRRIKAFSGDVPKNEPLPYFTYSAEVGSFGGALTLSALLWCDGGKANLARILDKVAEAIPESGAVVRTRSGAMVLYRGAGFLSEYPVEPNDTEKPICAGRISYEVHFYQT